LFTRTRRPGEKARDYVAQMQKVASKMPGLADDLMLWTILKIKAALNQQKNDIKMLAGRPT